jgi:hypothetical protein
MPMRRRLREAEMSRSFCTSATPLCAISAEHALCASHCACVGKHAGFASRSSSSRGRVDGERRGGVGEGRRRVPGPCVQPAADGGRDEIFRQDKSIPRRTALRAPPAGRAVRTVAESKGAKPAPVGSGRVSRGSPGCASPAGPAGRGDRSSAARTGTRPRSACSVHRLPRD